MVAIVSVLLIVILMGSSLYSFIFHKSYQRSIFSVDLFFTLICIYLIVLLSFGLLYFVLSFSGILLIEGGKLQEVGVLESLAHSLYFSGVTLMTVGYGDITPVGWGRLIALIEALIGYILPTAFVWKIWLFSNQSHRDPTNEADQGKKIERHQVD